MDIIKLLKNAKLTYNKYEGLVELDFSDEIQRILSETYFPDNNDYQYHLRSYIYNYNSLEVRIEIIDSYNNNNLLMTILAARSNDEIDINDYQNFNYCKILFDDKITEYDDISTYSFQYNKRYNIHDYIIKKIIDESKNK